MKIAIAPVCSIYLVPDPILYVSDGTRASLYWRGGMPKVTVRRKAPDGRWYQRSWGDIAYHREKGNI